MSVTLLQTDPLDCSFEVKFNSITPTFTDQGQTYGSIAGSANRMAGIKYDSGSTTSGCPFIQTDPNCKPTEECDPMNPNICSLRPCAGNNNCDQLCRNVMGNAVPPSRASMEQVAICPLFTYSDMKLNGWTKTDGGSEVYCWYDWQGSCAGIDNSSLNIGSAKSSFIFSPQSRGADWDVVDNNQLKPTLWIKTIYRFDFTNYNKLASNILNRWLTDLSTNATSADSQRLPADIIDIIYNSTLTKALFTDFYNQIYNTGYYSAQVPNNPIMTDYITNQSSISIEKNIFINQLGEPVCAGNNTTGCISKQLNKIWFDNLIIPTCYVEGTDCYINFNISAEIWKTITDLSQLDTLANTLLNNFFIDDGAVITVNDISKSPVKAVFVNTILVLGFQPTTSEPLGNYVDVVTNLVSNAPTKFISTVLMSIPLRTKVSVFSPTLIAYFSANFPSAVIANGQKMIADTGLMPTLYFNSLTSDNDKRTYVENYCDTIYLPSKNQHVLIGTFNQFILNSKTGICSCYVSGLVPQTNQTKRGNQTAMCFDNACTPEFNQLFGVTDCQSKCSQMCAWANATGPNTFTDPTVYNEALFEQTCGYSCDSVLRRKSNPIIPVMGTVLTLLMLLLTFSVCKYGSFSVSATVICMLVVFVIFAGLTAFFTDDFQCLPICGGDDGKTSLCLTKNTKLSVPTQFCGAKLPCECQFGVAGDCGSNCSCVSSMCLPLDGSTRPSHKEYQRDPNMIVVVIAIVISIIIPTILVYLHDDYHWDMSVETYSGLVGVMALIPFSIGMYELLHKKEIVVFDGGC